MVLRLFHRRSTVKKHSDANKTPQHAISEIAVPPVPTRSSSIAATAPSSPADRPIKTPGSRDSEQSADEPRLIRTPWELERTRKRSIWSRSGPEKEVLTYSKELPREVCDRVVALLGDMHLGGDQPCHSCYLRDLYSLALTNRVWERSARAQLYDKLYLLTSDVHAQSPKLKIRGSSRLKLLRRTLRDHLSLAQSVRELHLDHVQTLYQEASIEREEIMNLLASLIMACPLLERVVGFHAPFRQTFDRLSYALSSRTNLRERVWLLSAPDTDYTEDDDVLQYGHYVPAHDPTERFLELNSRQPNLTTLVLHQESERSVACLNFRAIIGTFRQFPQLRHLAVSALPSTSFTNITLNSLPPNLQSLRLDSLPGINDKGLQRFVASQAATSIERLTLVNLEIGDLSVLTSILSPHSSNLKGLTLAQQKSPNNTSQTELPLFTSSTLQYLHLELRSLTSSTSAPALNHLANSITASMLPSLRRLRIPHDPYGTCQSVCKPLPTALLPTDNPYVIHPKTHIPTTVTPPPKERNDSAVGSPILPSSPFPAPPQFAASPFATNAPPAPSRARFAAHERIVTARQKPRFRVCVTDPEGKLSIDTTIAGFVGTVGSCVEYALRPDREGEWVLGVGDLSVRGGSGWCDVGHEVGGRGMGVSGLF